MNRYTLLGLLVVVGLVILVLCVLGLIESVTPPAHYIGPIVPSTT